LVIHLCAHLQEYLLQSSLLRLPVKVGRYRCGWWVAGAGWIPICEYVSAAGKSNFSKSAIVMSPAKQLTSKAALSHVKYLYCIAIP